MEYIPGTSLSLTHLNTPKREAVKTVPKKSIAAAYQDFVTVGTSYAFKLTENGLRKVTQIQVVSA